MLALKAITVFVACWNIRPLAGRLTPIRYDIEDNGGFRVFGSGYSAEGFLVDGTIYGQGVATTGGHSNSLCFRGSIDPAKGTWQVKGKVGLKSLTATGSYKLSGLQEETEYALIESMAIGKATPVPAICGFITPGYMSTSGSITHAFNSDTVIDIYNYKNEEEVRYLIDISKAPRDMHPLISISTTSIKAPYDKPVCVSSYRRAPPNSWTATGHINRAAFSASGFYADQFWMLTELSTELGIFAGAYRADDTCAPTKDCAYEIEQTDSNSIEWLITGKAYTANGTWEITIPTGVVDNPAKPIDTRQVLKGTFTTDGTFRGHGHAAGFALSVNGNWGMGCLYTTNHSVSCSKNSITGLTARNSHGCGRASVGSGPFSGSGTYNGTRWNVTGSTIRDNHGEVIITGAVTYNQKLLKFQEYGDPANGVYLHLVQGDMQHGVFVRQIDTTWVAIGETE